MNKHSLTAFAYSKKGRLLAIGRNSYVKTHPVQNKYAKKADIPCAIYLHAEMAALIKAREPVHKLVIVRFTKDGKPANAKPCPICQLAIRDFNVKIVEHT